MGTSTIIPTTTITTPWKRQEVDFQDAHEKAHAMDIERRFAGRPVTAGQIVLFGITGGLMPCAAAVTVLLLCLQAKQIVLGMALVLAFSIGLAVTMVTVGAVAAWSLHYAGKAALRPGRNHARPIFPPSFFCSWPVTSGSRPSADCTLSRRLHAALVGHRGFSTCSGFHRSLQRSPHGHRRYGRLWAKGSRRVALRPAYAGKESLSFQRPGPLSGIFGAGQGGKERHQIIDVPFCKGKRLHVGSRKGSCRSPPLL